MSEIKPTEELITLESAIRSLIIKEEFLKNEKIMAQAKVGESF
jgi:hypothetical protein